MTHGTAEHKLKMRPLRRALQFAVVIVLIAVPFYTLNPIDCSPSRIVQGQMPQPTLFPVSGDTWSFQVGSFTLVHPVAFVEEALSSKVFYVPMVVAVLLPLGITLVLGRVFLLLGVPRGARAGA